MFTSDPSTLLASCKAPPPSSKPAFDAGVPACWGVIQRGVDALGVAALGADFRHTYACGVGARGVSAAGAVVTRDAADTPDAADCGWLAAGVAAR